MHFYSSGTVDFLLFHHPLSFSLTCLHAYLLLLFSHSPPLPLESVKTLWRWKWGRHRVRERVPHLPLNSKNSLSRSIDGSGCTASEGAIKAGKLRELIRLLLDRMERGEKRQESPQSTPIYTSVTTNVSPDFIWTYGNTIHWINPTMIDVWWRPSSVFLFFFSNIKGQPRPQTRIPRIPGMKSSVPLWPTVCAHVNVYVCEECWWDEEVVLRPTVTLVRVHPRHEN